MPKFSVTITHRLEVTATITMSATDEDDMQEKLDELRDNDGLGRLHWKVVGAPRAKWEEQEDDTDYTFSKK